VNGASFANKIQDIGLKSISRQRIRHATQVFHISAVERRALVLAFTEDNQDPVRKSVGNDFDEVYFARREIYSGLRLELRPLRVLMPFL
jgi:hypothetical protein